MTFSQAIKNSGLSLREIERRTTVAAAQLSRMANEGSHPLSIIWPKNSSYNSMKKDLGEPDFVNEEGIKWWVDKDITRYATDPDTHGTTLPNVVVWIVEEQNGHMTRVVSYGDQLAYENQSLEAIGVHIDKMKLLERMDTLSTEETQ